jgi:hypothetical protein
MNINTRKGFTRSELLVVMGVIAILAGLLLPALANPKTKGDTLTCLANLRHLIQSWAMYSDDNNGRLIMNFHGGDAQGGAAAIRDGGRNAPWASGWIDWTSRGDDTNILFLVDDRYAKLAKYTDRNPARFQCPADRFVSARQQRLGWTQRARSISMNLGIGDGNAESGPWNVLMYRHITTTAQFLYPGPSETFVFLEENADSINDPGFFSPQSPSTWTDQPASYHDAACSFAFADGRVELKKWTASLATPRAQQIFYNAAANAVAQRGDADIRWVNYRAGRLSTNSY